MTATNTNTRTVREERAAGTGIMMPLLMTTIMNVVPPQSRRRMMGRVGLVISLAPAIGPTLAGAVLQFASWRALFAIILPIALIALAMGAKWMTNLGETRKVPLDVLSRSWPGDNPHPPRPAAGFLGICGNGVRRRRIGVLRAPVVIDDAPVHPEALAAVDWAAVDAGVLAKLEQL